MRMPGREIGVTTGAKFGGLAFRFHGRSHLRAAFKQDEALIGFMCVRFERKPAGIAAVNSIAPVARSNRKIKLSPPGGSSASCCHLTSFGLTMRGAEGACAMAIRMSIRMPNAVIRIRANIVHLAHARSIGLLRNSHNRLRLSRFTFTNGAYALCGLEFH